MKKKENSKFGFTLIELIVVITIISLVATFGLATNFRAAQRTARDGKRKSDLEQIRSALEMYRADEGEYPPNITDYLIPDYLAVEPKDPKDPDRQYLYTPEDNTYILSAALERGEGVVGGLCGEEDCNYAVYSPGRAPVIPATPTPTSPIVPTPTPSPFPTPTPTPPPGPTATPTPTPTSAPTATPTPACERRRCHGWTPASGCTVEFYQLFLTQDKCYENCPTLAGSCSWECICP